MYKNTLPIPNPDLLNSTDPAEKKHRIESLEE